MNAAQAARWAGALLLAGLLAGIFSVAPAVDSTQYLIEAAQNTRQVTLAASFQLILSFAYAGFAFVLYPQVKALGERLAIGFLSLRIMASVLSIVGILLLLSVLSLSQEFLVHPTQEAQMLGHVLRASRDHANHVFMVTALCMGNGLLYVLLWRSKLIPRWLSAWGIIGAGLSVVASMLVLFQAVHIITPEYLSLNVPTAVQEWVLGIWLMAKGFHVPKRNSLSASQRESQ